MPAAWPQGVGSADVDESAPIAGLISRLALIHSEASTSHGELYQRILLNSVARVCGLNEVGANRR